MASEYVYTTKFFLVNPVIDFEKAREYLAQDNMVNYFDAYDNITEELVEKVTHIEWKLYTEDSGEIIVTTNSLLTEKEEDAVSEWIRGQNSDGLGESFEQQDFASYDYNAYSFDGRRIDDWELDDNYEEDWVMASFDWATNNYYLELQG